jgi:pimeloyl-ACP methyl ester carboxylesterase
LEKTLFVYDPQPVIQRVECPVLVIYGREEKVVPVDDSVAAFAHLLPAAQIVVLTGGDHRLQDEQGRFVSGYFETLRTFLDGVSLHRSS